MDEILQSKTPQQLRDLLKDMLIKYDNKIVDLDDIPVDYNGVEFSNSEITEVLYEKEPTPNNARQYLKSLRKEKDFEKAFEMHRKFATLYSGNKSIHNEKLWLLFYANVCDSKNEDYLHDAENILSNTNQSSKYSKFLFEITVLYILKRLVIADDLRTAYTWLAKLNPFLLDNKGLTQVNGNFYPSNLSRFYFLKAQIIIGLNQVEYNLDWYFSRLQFLEQRKSKFIQTIMEKITWQDHKGNSTIVPALFLTHLYNLDREIHFKRSYNSTPQFLDKKTISLSELSNYLFCPASYALNRTHNFFKEKPIDIKHIIDNRDGFYNRWIKANNSGNADDFFYDLPNNIIQYLKKICTQLVDWEIEVANKNNINPKILYSDNNKLSASPDYILVDKNGFKIALYEKFSSQKLNGLEQLYNSEIIEVEALLTKFKNSNITSALLFKWIWKTQKINNSIHPNSEEMIIVGLELYPYNIEDCRENVVDKTIEAIEFLIKGNEVAAENIGFVSKCLSCSVQKYCSHKSGSEQSLSIPYKIKRIN